MTEHEEMLAPVTTDVAPTGDDAGVPELPVGAPRHFPSFDGLRAIAVVSVLLLHASWVSGFTNRNSLGAYTSRLEVGVSVFFLISGFLLYRPFAVSHLTGRPGPNIRRFWQRRLLRIVPAYWVALTLMAYVFHWVTMGPGWEGVVSQYFFLQIYLPNQIFFGIGPAWSLCTEMSFYLFLPLYAAVISLRRRSNHAQLVREFVGLAVLYAISVVFRYWVLHLPIFTVRDGKLAALCAPSCATKAILPAIMVDWLPSYLDLFALGMFLAVVSVWLVEHRSEPAWLQGRSFPWLSWAAAGAAFIWVAHEMSDHEIFYLVVPRVNLEKQALYGAVAFFLLLPAVFGPQDTSLIRRFLQAWPVASVGVISYGIYLWHLNLISAFLGWVGWHKTQEPFWLLAVVVFGLAVGVASISYFCLERPILRYKRRISWWDRTPRPVGGSASGAPAEPQPEPQPDPAPGS